jgi:hypothetical protein
MNYIGWFLLSISLFTCTAALAEPVRVGKDIAYFYTEDEKSSYTFEEFLSIPESELIRKNSLSSIGYTSSALWVKFRLPSYLFKNGERWLELPSSTVSVISY